MTSFSIERIPAMVNTRQDRCIENWKHIRLQADGKHTFLDDVAKAAKKKLSPDKYATVQNWGEMSHSKLMHGHAQKNRFSPGDRLTVLAEAIKIDKRRNIPAPGTYSKFPQARVLQVPK